MLLNDFKTYLMETDVTKLTWAQYMEVDVAGNGTGLVDYWGNARPGWHSFRFWGDVPIERTVTPLFPSLQCYEQHLPSKLVAHITIKDSGSQHSLV